jgi:type I restriction enzyme S subunit
MGEWRECKISEIADVIGGGTPKTEIEEYWNGNIPWLAPRDLTGYSNVYISHGDRFITEMGLKNSSTKLMPKGSVLLTSRAPIGYVAIAQNEICTNQGFKSLVPKNGVCISEFLYYWIKNSVDYLQQLGSGTTFAEISGSVVKDIDISLPPLEEQKAIAEVLNSLDDKIDLLHRQNKTLEEMAQTLFRQWFIEEAREEWEVVKLDNILTITSSKRVFYSEYVSNGVPFYRSKEIIELHNTGQTKGELYISEDRYNEIVDKFGPVVSGDVLLTSVGTLGIPYRVNQDDRFYFKDGNLTWFKDFTKLPSLIILYWLKSDIGKEELDAIAIGSTQAALTINSLKSIQLALPPIDIINKLEEQLIVIDNKLQANLKQIKTLENMRDTLLPKLMSGEVRVEG